MNRDREGHDAFEDLSGSVYGVHLRGRLPGGFQAYLATGEGPSAGNPDRLDVSYRHVDALPEVDAIWSSETEGPDRVAHLSLFGLPRGFGLSVSGAGRGRFHCSRRAIRIEWSTPEADAPHAFFSYALPLWLETEGVPVLHGSAVSLGEGAVAFLGRSGMGKSVLCAELVRAGCGFLADDGVALRRNPRGDWLCAPGPPLLRLWPSGLESRLGIDPATLPKVQSIVEKRRLHLDGESPPPAAGRPLAAVYLLRRRPETGGPVSVAECSPRDALARLIEHGVAAGPAAALGWSERRLRLLADVVERVPVRELRYSGGGDSAARIREAIVREA
ncbi:MAG: hypothetical protein PVG07_10900 [Acidobacteriota bacterium]|jgi:hypothetical protein